MLKKISIIGALLCMLSFPASLLAQEDESSVDVDLAFVSGYVFRGTDLFAANYYNQKGEAIDSGQIDGTWAFQPSITFNSGSGAYFNIWGSMAMQNRQDVDTDGLLETSPTGNEGFSGYTAAYTAALTEFATDPLGASKTGLPGYYEEANGLRRIDEVDFSFGYAVDTASGSMDMGVLVYLTPIAPEVRGGAGDTLTEIYFSYNLPAIGGIDALTGLGFSVNQELGGGLNGGNTYATVGYGSSIPLGEDLSFDFGTSLGHQWSSGRQGWRDWTSSVGISVAGFSVAFNYVVRPDFGFHDTDATALDLDGDGVAETTVSDSTPAWLTGGSTAGDGLVANPAFSDQLSSAVIQGGNQQLAVLSPGYTYVERQKLPRALWYISAGYSFSL